MSNLKEQVLGCIADTKKGKLSRKEIASILQIEKSADLVKLNSILEQLEEEMAVIRDTKNCYSTPTQAGYISGRISINRKGVGFVDRENEESIVIEPEYQGDAMDGDTVLLRISDPIENSGRVVKVTEHVTTHLIGTFSLTTKGLKCTPDDEKISNRPYTIRYAKDFQPMEGLKVVLAIERYGRPLILNVDRVIGFKDDPGVDILSILLDHDIEPAFPEEVIANAKEVAVEVSEEDCKGRRDLRQETIVTIDGDDSKDFDDAVGVKVVPEGWQLTVCIADVTHYVKEGSPLDIEALKRGTSTYAVNTVVPMLPHILSNGICSLNPHEDRLSNTCEMIVARDGSIVSYEIYPSVMRSTERMTYNNVNLILKRDEEMRATYAHLGNLFTDLAGCADAIRKFRHKKGAIDFDSTESEIKVDENGHPIEIKARERGHAEEMIEDCMIAANVCVADYMNKKGLPCVYRVHEQPQARRLKDFEKTSFMLGHKLVLPKTGPITPIMIQSYLESCKQDEEYPVLSKMVLRTMQKAKYEAKCLGHFGLAEDNYLHFTSPIRRYPDLVVHRMLRKYVFEACTDEKQLMQDTTFVEEASEHSSIRERASQDAEWEANDMKKAEYMMDHLGEEAEGIITTVTSFGFYVQLPNTIEGLVRITSLNDDYYVFDQTRFTLEGSRKKKKYCIGQTIKITVLSANKSDGTVEFGLVEKRKRFGYGDRRSSYGGREDRSSSFKRRDSKSPVDRRERGNLSHHSRSVEGKSFHPDHESNGNRFGGRNDRKPYARRDGEKSYSSDRKPYAKRDNGSFERKPYAKRDGEKSYSSDRKPYARRDGEKSYSSDRKPYAKREGGSFGHKSNSKSSGGFHKSGSFSRSNRAGNRSGNTHGVKKYGREK